MHQDYITPALRELRDQLVRFAPRERRWEQVAQTERLLAEVAPERVYPYEFLCYRITNYRPTDNLSVKIFGRDVLHDLRLLVEDLSESAGLQAELAGERVMTIEELAKRLNVSTKTIARWRRSGLVSRRFVMDGRSRVGFLQSSVERFVSQNPEKVRRGRQFSQMSEEERNSMIEWARRLAAAGGYPAEVARRLAEQTGRSIETVRYTLKNFDEQNPDIAIFPDSHGPLPLETKRKIFQLHHRGESAETLARRYGRKRGSIYRIVNEMRALRVLELPLDFIPNNSFSRVRTPAQEGQVCGPMPEADTVAKKPRLPSGLPPYLASLYEVPLLTRTQEMHLFRKMNFLKYKAAKLRAKLDPASPKSSLMDQIEQCYEAAVETKNQIIRANLRLVVSIAKRHVGPIDNFFELVSDGNMSLMRAVEKFDYSRGNKFSTYASWAIMKNFARTIPDEHRRRDRFRTTEAEVFSTTPDVKSELGDQEAAQAQREFQIESILSCLDDREQAIIIKRFGLRRGHEPLTLKEVGAELGVTKERIRQIEARALTKLRKAAEEEKIEFPS